MKKAAEAEKQRELALQKQQQQQAQAQQQVTFITANECCVVCLTLIPW